MLIFPPLPRDALAPPAPPPTELDELRMEKAHLQARLADSERAVSILRAELDKRDARIAELDALAKKARHYDWLREGARILQGLVSTLPKCDFCGCPATRSRDRGKPRVCDQAACNLREQTVEKKGTSADPYPRAPSVRLFAAWQKRSPRDF